MIFNLYHPNDPLADLARFAEHGTYDGGDYPDRHWDRCLWQALQAMRSFLAGDRPQPVRVALETLTQLALRGAVTSENPDEATLLVRHLEARLSGIGDVTSHIKAST